MAKLAKFLQGVAGAAGGAGLNVEEVFSTYLYDGTGTTKTISNGIDLSTEGGMTWFKRRNGAGDNQLFDSERTGRYRLESNTTDAQADEGAVVWNTRTDGFSIGGDGGAQIYNSSGDTYASWTFRKASKFFDVVTYTGDGVAGRTVSHNLGTTVGSIFIKELTQSDYRWMVYHRSLGNGGLLRLDSNGAASYNNTAFNSTDPASDLFTLGDSAYVNGSGKEYVAYLFAHNDGDGEFGPDGDADIIKCGSFTTDSSGDASVDIGFEPQWIIYKRSDGTSNWGMNDNMRGWADTYWNPLYADASNAESGFAATRSWPTATGFEFEGQLSASANYIYIAIRRGPMAVPESAIDVFDAAITTSGGKITTGFVTDMSISNLRSSNASYNSSVASRLTGNDKRLLTSSTAAEASSSGMFLWDYNDGMYNDIGGSNQINWMWRRAPNFFDVVAWKGSGTSGYEYVDHNLGVTPEMIWFKNRDSSATPRGNWYVYHKDLANSNGYVFLNNTPAEATDYPGWATGSAPFSDTRFVVQKSRLSYTNEDYIAYLFATVDGVSKVGSFTGNGSSTGDSQDIDCGFSSGARFVLVKAISAAGAWFLFDTERGIVAGNDSHLSLNNTSAEDTSRDLIDPYSSGFTINYHSDWGNQLNGNGQTYIFYAIA